MWAILRWNQRWRRKEANTHAKAMINRLEWEDERPEKERADNKIKKGFTKGKLLGGYYLKWY